MDPNDLRACVEQAIEELIEPVAWNRCEVVNRAEQESLRTILIAAPDRAIQRAARRQRPEHVRGGISEMLSTRNRPNRCSGRAAEVTKWVATMHLAAARPSRKHFPNVAKSTCRVLFYDGRTCVFIDRRGRVSRHLRAAEHGAAFRFAMKAVAARARLIMTGERQT